MKYSKIIQNFQNFDKILETLLPSERKVAQSIKMMYAIHMENHQKNIFPFGLIQIGRAIGKLLLLPFSTYTINSNISNCKAAVLKSSYGDELLAGKLHIPCAQLEKRYKFNTQYLQIYQILFSTFKSLILSGSLSKYRLLLLLHRMLDYLTVYYTVTVDFSKVLVENDRDPKNLAVIHRLQEKKGVAIKYDQWLIDPVHHNDVYCDIYFYPSVYHKQIIEGCKTNRHLQYIEGGFPLWDNLSQYMHKDNHIGRNIIYFTQFGMDPEIHRRYILDINAVLAALNEPYQIVVKVHPREKKEPYINLYEISEHIQVLAQCDDVYALIGQSDYCFSVFSTVSLEAKHIVEHSYFINYAQQKFDLVDYDSIGLDVVSDYQMLTAVFDGRYSPVDKSSFIQSNNCAYPETIRKLKGILND